MQPFATVAPDCWQLIRQLIRETLQGEHLTYAYGEAILARINRWAEGWSAETSIAHLPILTCQTAGGTLEQVVPVAAAWQALHIAAKLFDDVEDGDAADPAADVNIATATLVSVPLLLAALGGRGVPQEQVQRLSQSAHRAVLLASAGQHADLLASRGDPAETDPERWLAIARAKSGALLAWASWAGAVVAGAEEALLQHYDAYGEHLGVLLQVADDFDGIWQSASIGDLATKRLSLPICYALSVVPPEQRDDLRQLLAQAADQPTASQAIIRQRLTELGAQTYMLFTARLYQQHALAALDHIATRYAATDQLTTLIDQTFPALKHLKRT